MDTRGNIAVAVYNISRVCRGSGDDRQQARSVLHHGRAGDGA